MTAGPLRTEESTILLELRRGWKVVVSAMIGIGLGLSFLIYTFSTFVKPLETEFGWSRTSIALAPAFVSLFILLLGAVAGRMCDRYGARTIILPSILFFAATLASLSLLRGSVIWLYAGFSVATALGIGTSAITYTRIVSRWFDKARGLALGLATTGAGITALVMPPILTNLIDSAGWRLSWIVCGLIVVLAFLPAYLFLHDQPVRDGGRPVPQTGISMRGAVRDHRFWCLAVAASLISTVVGGTVVHLMAMLSELGFSRSTSAQYVSALGGGVICGRLLAGLLLDRLPGPPLAAAMIMGTVIGYLMLYNGVADAAPVAIFLIGLTMGSEGDFLAFFTSRYFGMKSYSEIYGWLYVMLSIGSATGPIVIGLLYGSAGYTTVYVVFAALCALAALLMSLLGRYREFPTDPDQSAHALDGGFGDPPLALEKH